MDQEIETKLRAARARLILDKPFLGALVLRLPLVAADADWCPTTATDARACYYNPLYIRDLSLEQTEFVLAHEALHCALSHFTRRQHRVRRRWDLACDLAINPLLVKDGLKPPLGVLLADCYGGMTAEEIYPYVQDGDTAGPMDRHLYDDHPDERAGAGQSGAPASGHGAGGALPESRSISHAPPPLSAGERERLAAQWRRYLASAAQQARQAGKLSGAMARLVGQLLQPQLPWRALLARYMTAVARDDYSYARPSRREGPAILPRLYGAHVAVIVVIDTSGSITDEELGQFFSEVNAIKSQVRARLTLHACDAALAPDGPWVFEPWEPFVAPRAFSGGGGTRFTPVFEWLETQNYKPDLVLYFTDALGEFPAHAPDYPVLWLVKGNAPVPWGQRIQLN